MPDPTLRLQLLEAPLIINGFVQGDRRSNYEYYLTELLNCSTWFKNMYKEPFVAPLNQSHGENDVCTGEYGLDYKLFASKTALQARSIHSLQVEKIGEHEYETIGAKVQSTMQTTRIHVAFRHRSLAELDQCRKADSKMNGVENDINTVLKILETDKNLFLFYPYRFSTESDNDFLSEINIITQEINRDFVSALQYRTRAAPLRDTFFSYLFNEQLVIAKLQNNSLVNIDHVPTHLSAVYNHLEWLSE